MSLAQVLTAPQLLPATCRVMYHSGSVEVDWLSDRRVATNRQVFCNLSTHHSMVTKARHWLAYTTAASAAADGSSPPPEPEGEEQRAVLSRFVNDGRTEWIEPLSGMARHPFFHPWGGKCHFDKQVPKRGATDTNYLLPANLCGSTRPPRRSIFYDLGAGGPRVNVDAIWNRETYSSIPYFVEAYRRRCVTFDDIFAWEAATLDHPKWWSDVPLELRHKIRLYNTPVVEDVNGTASSATSASSTGQQNIGCGRLRCVFNTTAAGRREAGSFLSLLRATARPEDFVAIKVDIDGGPELFIVNSINERPELRELVDEIFFEFHFWNHGVFDAIWSSRLTPAKDGTVLDALRLMLSLRRRGIRSHFWI